MQHASHATGLLALTVAVAACSDPSGVRDDGNVQVRAFATDIGQPIAATGADVQTVQVDRILLVIGRVKLEKAESGTTDFVDESSVVVELERGAAATLAVVADLPPGSYKEIEIAVDKLERGHATEQSLINAYPGLDNASILIEGTVTRLGSTEQFRFATDLDIDLEIAFAPPLIIDGFEPTQKLLSLVLDVGSWFRSDSGRLLDPTRADNRSHIEGAIQKSIELFEDPDRNGRR